MEIKFTARHFRARQDLRDHAIDAVKKLDRFYDGIVMADIILSYERANKSVKTAEIVLTVYGMTLTAKEGSDDYVKSIDAVIEKMTQQLSKYKSKLRMKDKTLVREMQAKV